MLENTIIMYVRMKESSNHLRGVRFVSKLNPPYGNKIIITREYAKWGPSALSRIETRCTECNDEILSGLNRNIRDCGWDTNKE
jgi:hypothetical protein